MGEFIKGHKRQVYESQKVSNPYGDHIRDLYDPTKLITHVPLKDRVIMHASGYPGIKNSWIIDGWWRLRRRTASRGKHV